MHDYATLRQRMVDNQIRPSEVTDHEVLKAFLEVPRELDRPALTAFLANARSDPAAATRPVAAAEVARIVAIFDDADAGPDTEIPVVDMTADLYLADLAARLHPVWPDLAADLSAVRSGL